jgi:hypothetical protein
MDVVLESDADYRRFKATLLREIEKAVERVSHVFFHRCRFLSQ